MVTSKTAQDSRKLDLLYRDSEYYCALKPLASTSESARYFAKLDVCHATEVSLKEVVSPWLKSLPVTWFPCVSEISSCALLVCLSIS